MGKIKEVSEEINKHFGTVHCGNKECEKELAFFPVDNQPKDLELYCTICMIDLVVQECKESENG